MAKDLLCHTRVQRRYRRSAGTHLRAEEPGGALATGAVPTANGAAVNTPDGRSPLGKYITELTSIRAALLKASEEHLAMQKQLKEARCPSWSASHGQLIFQRMTSLPGFVQNACLVACTIGDCACCDSYE